jgi:hypothetical protein
MPTKFDDCEVVRDSGKALLVKIDDLGGNFWIPKSVIHDDSEVFDDEENSKGTLVVADWFAERELS